MRFVSKHAGVCGERVGCLTGFIKSPSSVIETPTAALFTQGGSVVHLTVEVLSKVFTTPQLLWVPLSNSYHLENGMKAQNEGVAKFAGLPDYFTCVTLQNASDPTPSGHFEGDRVPLWTKYGKKLLTADRYMDLMEVYKPDMYVAIADGHTSLTEPKKRILKSVGRTHFLLNKCVERHKSSTVLDSKSLIGVIVGTAQTNMWNKFIQDFLKHSDSLFGVAVAGITDGTEDSFNIPVDKLISIFKKIGEEVPKDLLRIIEGCWDPAVILIAIEHGWDLFDGSYPLKLTNAGFALRLNFDVTKEDDSPYFLNLNDAKYKEDFTPILAGCECLACTKHTRAYIRHLLNTREMLANVLLSIHNLYHFDQMFHHIRQHIVAKTFQSFKNHITKQCEANMLVIPKPDNDKSTAVIDGSLKKKKKVDADKDCDAVTDKKSNV